MIRRPPRSTQSRSSAASDVYKRQEVLGALAQRWKVDPEHGEAVEEVLAKLAFLDGAGEVAVRGRYDARVGLEHLRPAQPLKLALFQDPEELRLHGRAHLARFVQEERASRGLLDAAGLRGRGARKGDLLVSEQLGFEKLVGQGRAVERDERPRRARRA